MAVLFASELSGLKEPAPVRLTPTAPANHDLGYLKVFKVHKDDVSRSNVLSCVVQAGGDAVLPGAISLTEFNTWLTWSMSTVDEGRLEIPYFQLVCTVLKVTYPLQKSCPACPR